MMVMDYALALGKYPHQIKAECTPSMLAQYIAYKDIIREHQEKAAQETTGNNRKQGKGRRIVRTM